MRMPKVNWSFVKGLILGAVILGVIYAGYNFGMKFDALKVAWKFPEVVRNLEIREVLEATMSGQLLK